MANSFSNTAGLGAAIVAAFAKRTNARGQNLGKTALQKHVYFLQTLFGADCGFEFRLYTYGPFSSELLNELDRAELVDAVIVKPAGGLGGYSILPGSRAEEVLTACGDSLVTADQGIEAVLDNFGSYNAKELELRATAVYAEREAREDGRQLHKEELVALVHGIKPHFATETIRAAVEELIGKEFVEVTV